MCCCALSLAEGCNVYNPQKVRQGGSEYKRLMETGASLREKGEQNVKFTKLKARSRLPGPTSICFNLRGAPDEFRPVGQYNVPWVRRFSMAFGSWLTRHHLSGPGLTVWRSSRFKQMLIIICNNCPPLTSGQGWLTLRDHSSWEALFNSPETYGDKFQQSNAHIPPSSNTWQRGISQLVRFSQVNKWAESERET